MTRFIVLLLSLLTMIPTVGLTQTSAKATVSWSYVDAGQDGFVVSRSDNGSAFAPVGTLAKSDRQFLDPALAAGVMYCYTVTAYNAAGQAPASTPACGKKDVIVIPPGVTSITVILQ